jgi:hypothetical protein
MNKCYVKLFQKILDSTIWLEDDRTRIVWITLLAMCDEDGIVDAPLPAIANRARVDLESCTGAILKFQQPDLDSRTTEHDGRRIQKVDGGWLILNHKKYRDMMSLEHRREYKRLKAQEYREQWKQMDRGKTIRDKIREKVKAGNFVEQNINETD